VAAGTTSPAVGGVALEVAVDWEGAAGVVGVVAAGVVAVPVPVLTPVPLDGTVGVGTTGVAGGG
jgi:hypothetical protein